jgi:hypothetical protein
MGAMTAIAGGCDATRMSSNHATGAALTGGTGFAPVFQKLEVVMADIVPINNMLATELLNSTAIDAGKGVSTKFEDQETPFVYVLQNNSPAVDTRGSEYVEGAKPGDFLLRGAVEPVRDGVAGIVAIPCGMARTWLEWLPSRQGYAGRHDQQPADAEEITVNEGGRERLRLVRPNGHIIEDTREFFLLIDRQPYVLGCAGTKHTFARQWQTWFRQFKHPKTGATLPSFARKYQLTTWSQANAKGRWFGLKFRDLGYLNDIAEYNAARAFNEIVEQGRARVEAPREP